MIIMKKSVIFVVFVIIFSSLSFAKVVDVPSVGEGEEIPLPLVQENIKRYIYSGSNILASIENNEIIFHACSSKYLENHFKII